MTSCSKSHRESWATVRHSLDFLRASRLAMSADRDEWDGGSLRTSGYDTEEDSMPEFEVPEGEEMEDAQDVAAEELEGAEDEHSVLIAPPSVTEATVELPERSTKPPELPEEPVAAPSSGEFKDMVDENQAKQPPSAQDLDWKALESKFAADMYNKRVEEHDIQEQFDALMKVRFMDVDRADRR